MLSEIQLERYAEVLLWGLRIARSKPFKRGDVVLVRFNLDAVPLAQILERRLLEQGMNPVRRLHPTPEMEKISLNWPTVVNWFSIHPERTRSTATSTDPSFCTRRRPLPICPASTPKNQPFHPLQEILAGHSRGAGADRRIQLDLVHAAHQRLGAARPDTP